MARFYRTSKPTNIDFMYELPENHIMKAIDNIEKQNDILNAGVVNFNNALSIPVHSRDKERVEQELEPYRKGIEELTKEIDMNPHKVASLTPKFRELSKGLMKKMKSGYVADAVYNYGVLSKDKATLDAALQEYLKDPKGAKGLAPYQVNAMKAYMDKNYLGAVDDKGNPVRVSSLRLPPNIDLQKHVLDIVKEMSPQEIKIDEEKFGQGELSMYTIDEKNNRVYLPKERIWNVVVNALNSSDKAKDYIALGTEYGYLQGDYKESPFVTKKGKDGKEYLDLNPKSALYSLLATASGVYERNDVDSSISYELTDEAKRARDFEEFKQEEDYKQQLEIEKEQREATASALKDVEEELTALAAEGKDAPKTLLDRREQLANNMKNTPVEPGSAKDFYTQSQTSNYIDPNKYNPEFIRTKIKELELMINKGEATQSLKNQYANLKRIQNQTELQAFEEFTKSENYRGETLNQYREAMRLAEKYPDLGTGSIGSLMNYTPQQILELVDSGNPFIRSIFTKEDIDFIKRVLNFSPNEPIRASIDKRYIPLSMRLIKTKLNNNSGKSVEFSRNFSKVSSAKEKVMKDKAATNSYDKTFLQIQPGTKEGNSINNLFYNYISNSDLNRNPVTIKDANYDYLETTLTFGEDNTNLFKSLRDKSIDPKQYFEPVGVTFDGNGKVVFSVELKGDGNVKENKSVVEGNKIYTMEIPSSELVSKLKQTFTKEQIAQHPGLRAIMRTSDNLFNEVRKFTELDPTYQQGVNSTGGILGGVDRFRYIYTVLPNGRHSVSIIDNNTGQSVMYRDFADISGHLSAKEQAQEFMYQYAKNIQLRLAEIELKNQKAR